MNQKIIFILITFVTVIGIKTGFSQNYSLLFDGDDDFVEVNNSTLYNFEVNDFTLEHWFKTTDVLTGHYSGTILKLGGTNHYYDITPRLIDFGKPVFHFANGDGQDYYATATSDLDDGAWHLISGVRQSNTIYIYIDGILEGQGTLPPNANADNNGNLKFRPHTAYASPITCLLDEVSIWNRALSAQEIQDQLYTELNGNETGLIGYWKFNEGSGNIAHDSSLYSNDGTIYGATWSPDVPINQLVLNAVTAIPDTICESDSSQLNVEIQGGNGTITFQWTSNPSGFTSDIQNPFVSPDTTTWYIVTVSDNDTAFVDSVQVVVNMLPEVFTISGGGSYCEGGLGVDIILDSSEVNYQYELYLDESPTGNVLQGTGDSLVFTEITQVGEYTIWGSNNNCFQEMGGSAFVSLLTVYENEEICIITVDSSSNYNLIVWNKTHNVNTQSFVIYKESTQSGVYFVLDTVPFDSLNAYIDETSNPLIKSDRYKISVIDSCDNESELSPFHKTIHLTINSGMNGWNLIWSHYEGFDFETYYILRKELPGEFEIIDSIQSTLNSYSDINPPIVDLDYKIMIVKDESCISSIGLRDVYDKSFSNVSSTATVATPLVNLNNIKLIYDQNSKELRFIDPGNKFNNITLNIIDLQGRMTKRNEFHESSWSIKLDDIESGVYIVQLIANDFIMTKKIIR